MDANEHDIILRHKSKKRNISFISVLHFSVTIIMVFNNKYYSYPKISLYSAVAR